MRNKEYQTISKMIEYINKAEKYTQNINFEEFSNNEMKIDATVFVISQIGELVKNIDENFQEAHSNVKWHILKGLRNRIVHDYEGIKLDVIWDIVTRNIFKLKSDLEEILKNEKIEN